MKKFKVVISDIAERDLLGSYYYIYFELQNPIAAEKFKDTLENKINSLSEVPFAGEIHEKLPNYRVAHALDYRIFYFADEATKTIVITRVFHARRQDPTLL